MISGLENCVCKIKYEINKNGKLELITATGFFCNIQSKNIKVFITNNHVLNQDFLDKKKKLALDIEEEKKVINLKNRFKYTFKELDFTII